MNPYAELGFGNHSHAAVTTKMVRAAYRRLARKSHPDTGGDPIAFARLKLAHDILIDPARRTKYDATGDVSEQAPDNSLAEVLAFISVAMEQVAAQNAKGIEHFDFVAAIRQCLTAHLADTRTGRQKITTTMALWSMAAGRFAVSEGSPNYLADIARGKVKQLEEHHRAHEARERAILKAIELLKDASFVYDRAERMEPWGASNFLRAKMSNTL